MNNKVEYENRLVAFIDILGFSEIVKQSKGNNDKINLIYSVLNHLKDWEASENWDLKLIEIEENAQKRGVSTFDNLSLVINYSIMVVCKLRIIALNVMRIFIIKINSLNAGKICLK